MRYVQVYTQCKNCNIETKLKLHWISEKPWKGRLGRPQIHLRFLWKLQNLRKIGKFSILENSLNIVKQLKRRLRWAWTKPLIFVKFAKIGQTWNRWFQSCSISLYFTAMQAKCKAIDTIFFYYSQYANNIHLHKHGFALSLVLKAIYFWNSQMVCLLSHQI